MAIKAQFEKLEDIAEASRGDYKLVDGVYKLQIEGGEPDGFVPFASFKRELDRAQKSEEKLKPFKGVVLEDLQRKAKAYDDLGGDDQKTIIESKVATATKAVVEDKARLEKENLTLKQKVEESVVGSALATAAVTLKVRPEAIDDFITRGRKVFKADESGKSVAFEGDTPINGKSGKPLTIEEWGGGLRKTASFLFLPSVGGGAHNEGSGASGTVKNPFDPKAKDITQQAVLIRTNRTLAKTMAAEFGIDLDDPAIMTPTIENYELKPAPLQATPA